MLVYIREADKEKVICNVDEKDIAEHLRVSRFSHILEPKISQARSEPICILLATVSSKQIQMTNLFYIHIHIYIYIYRDMLEHTH